MLGLALRAGMELYRVIIAWRQAGDRDLPASPVFRTTVAWLVPVRLLRARPVYSVLSFVFHAGIILVPLFFPGLWRCGRRASRSPGRRFRPPPRMCSPSPPR